MSRGSIINFYRSATKGEFALEAAIRKAVSDDTLYNQLVENPEATQNIFSTLPKVQPVLLVHAAYTVVNAEAGDYPDMLELFKLFLHNTVNLTTEVHSLGLHGPCTLADYLKNKKGVADTESDIGKYGAILDLVQQYELSGQAGDHTDATDF